MVCNPAPPKVTYVPDFFALATCPFCREQQIISHHDLQAAGRAIDGSAEWVCAFCKGLEKSRPTN